MTTSTNTQVHTTNLRDWHKKTDIQKFIASLSKGDSLEAGKFECMSQELAEIVLSHIDSEEAFINMAHEYAPRNELETGHEVYTVEGETLYLENSNALLEFAMPTWVRRDSDIVESLYDSISCEGIGDITHCDINNAFFNGVRDSYEEKEAWRMGIYIINNKALHCLLGAYVAYKGITAFKVNEGSYNSIDVDIVTDKFSDSLELTDAEIVIGGQVLFVTQGSKIKALKNDLQALADKYRN
ncbi:MAG: hypothetical protein J6N72_02295 [Psychrobacter sp.]|nr:hypothetical protein [Psychrobacter sp.]